MKGFQNIGNTCYLNAGLQMLVQNRDLCQLINKYSSSSEILGKISNFINEYYDESSTDIINPLEIKKIVEDKNDIFEGYLQQDSTEFIVLLLGIIDDEIKKVHKDSIGIQSIFGIKINVRIKCKLRECLQINNKKEFNNFLLLDIDSNCASLEDVYRNFKSCTKLESDNKYFCENCQAKRTASKRHSIDELPKYINIWLKRFTHNGITFTKINQPIDIPLVWKNNLHLQGAIIHSGSLNGGHYVYVGKHESKWFLFNDSSINEINTSNELKKVLSKAYWVYYTR